MNLWHSDYDKNLNGYSLRGIALNTEGYRLETKWQKRIKAIPKYLLIVLLFIACILITHIVTDLISSTREHEETRKWFMKEYYGPAKEVQKKKAEIAGAGDNTRQ